MSNNTSLQNIENYINTINTPITDIFSRYIMIMNEYTKQIIDNVFIHNITHNKYVIDKGIEIISHVFNILFLYTKNIDLTSYHCQKSLYYYIEFVGQLGDMHKILQLSSKDSALFIFKKTIFEINNDIRSQYSSSDIDNEKINIINSLTKLYNIFLLSILEDNFVEGYDKNNLKKIISTSTPKILNYLLDFFKDETDLKSKYEKLHSIIYLINEVKNKKMKINKYVMFEKFSKKIITKKYISPEQIHKRLENLYELCDDPSKQTKIIKLLCL